MRESWMARPVILALLAYALFLLFFYPQNPARAASLIYVRTDGDDWICTGEVDAPYTGGSYPQLCAVQTFNRAHQLVDAGGEIHVAAGTYNDGFSIGKDLTIVGAGPDQTIIDRQGDPWGIAISYISPNPPPVVAISGFTVQNAAAAGQGAGVVNGGAMVTLDSCIIRNNTAWSAAGVHNAVDGMMVISNCVIEGNTATGTFGGAGILNEGSLYLQDTTVRDNHADEATASGGGLLNDNTSGHEIIILRSTFSGNSAEQFGSAFHDQGDGDVQILNSTVSGNTVNATYGPGDGTITVGSNGTFDIRFSTIAGNFATGVGVEGGIVTYGPVVISNSIVADNDNAECLAGGTGSITSQGNNIDSGTSCGFTASGDMQNTDPLLGALDEYGGPTETLVLLAGSPAIDTAGDIGCAQPELEGIDQRGVPRPIGISCDIGAYEAEIRTFLPLIAR